MLDSLSLKNTKLGLETLELMGYNPEQISLVLNRADTRVGITHEDVDAIIGRSPDILVPSDRQIPISVNDGMPIVIEGRPVRSCTVISEACGELRGARAGAAGAGAGA